MRRVCYVVVGFILLVAGVLLGATHVDVDPAYASRDGSSAYRLPYSVELDVEAPQVGQQSLITFTVTADSSEVSGASEIVLRVPSYYNAAPLQPAGGTVSPAWSSDRYVNVVWAEQTAVATPVTFTVAVSPTFAAEHGLYDDVAGVVHPDDGTYDLYAGSSETAYVRVGDAGAVGEVVDPYPNAQQIMTDGFSIGSTTTDGGVFLVDGQGVQQEELSTLDVDQLPLMKPLGAAVSVDGLVDADTPISVSLRVNNTITTTVDFTGTVTMPSQWEVVEGHVPSSGVLSSACRPPRDGCLACGCVDSFAELSCPQHPQVLLLRRG